MPLDLTDTTIVFDLDGTIVDTAPDLTAATNHALGLVGLAPVTVAELHPFIGHGSKAMIEAGLRFRGRGVAEDEAVRLHEAFLAFYAANIAVGSRPYAGVPELLDRLARRRRAAGGVHQQVRGPFQGAARRARARSTFRRRRGTRHVRRVQAGCGPPHGHDRDGRRPARARGHGRRQRHRFRHRAAASVPAIGVTFGYTPRPVRELAPGDGRRGGHRSLRRVLARARSLPATVAGAG